MSERAESAELLGRGSLAPSPGPMEFSGFFQAEYTRLLRAVYLVVQSRDLAEDVVQDAFLVTWNHWSRVSAYQRPDLWLRRVAIRLAIRSAKRARTSTLAIAEPVVEAHETDLDLVAGIAALAPAQRAAIVLFYLEDRPVSELAEIMKCSPATAKVHLHRARRRLSVLLEGTES